MTVLACFNSRSRVGSDIKVLIHRVKIIKFQFTLPCRERQGWNKVSWEWRLIPCSARSIAQIELSKIGNGGGDFCCL